MMSARRTFTDVDAQARGHERVGVKLHALKHRDRIDVAQAKGLISEEAASWAKAQIDAFAQEIATGLHVDGHDGIATRRVVRAMLVDAGVL